MAIAVGAEAPDFTLPGVNAGERRDYTLSSMRGTPVVLVFYPGDNTPVCTRQLNQYTQNIGRFADVGAQVLAISPQSVQSHEGFACQQGGFGFPLLADEDKAVGATFGVVGPLGFYRRSVFVINRTGSVTYVHRALAGVTFRATDELVKAVAASA